MDRMGCQAEVPDPGKSGSGRHDGWHESAQADGSHGDPSRQEKPLARGWVCPYRTPTQVGEGRCPQVDERTSVKELGKLTPYLWKKGGPSSEETISGLSVRGMQEAGSSDCLPKTQVSAKAKAEV
jgi:hypothetical protein